MRFLIGFVACVSLVIPGAAFGQTVGATTGAINGKVVDPSDAVLPGVTVTISAPQMQGEQTAMTNADGNYRFPGIPPGTYRVRYELPGFAQVVREGIRVTLGFTATLERDDAGVDAAGNRDGHRRHAGRGCVVDQDLHQLRLQ